MSDGETGEKADATHCTAEGSVSPQEGTAVPDREDASDDRQRMFCALAAAELAELTWDALQECQREGVDLPPGFVRRFAEKLARRAVSSGLFGRFGWRVYRLGVDRGIEVVGEGWKAP